jgi:hypothetical protein
MVVKSALLTGQALPSTALQSLQAVVSMDMLVEVSLYEECRQPSTAADARVKHSCFFLCVCKIDILST